jgi:hypothetical protein
MTQSRVWSSSIAALRKVHSITSSAVTSGFCPNAETQHLGGFEIDDQREVYQ